jgi:hypothetical protein
MNDDNPPELIASEYFHVGNGGANFRIFDRGYGAEVELSVEFFAACKGETTFKTTREGLEAMKRVIDAALAYGIESTYPEAALPREGYAKTRVPASA